MNIKGAFSLCVLRALTRVSEYCIFMSKPISVLKIWIGHFDWLAHEYAMCVDVRSENAP